MLINWYNKTIFGSYYQDLYRLNLWLVLTLKHLKYTVIEDRKRGHIKPNPDTEIIFQLPPPNDT